MDGVYEWNRRNGEHNQHENVTVTIDPQGKVKKLTKDSWRGATWSHGNSSAPLDLNNLLKIQVGKTTREEVERLLGQPQWESVMEREGDDADQFVLPSAVEEGTIPVFGTSNYYARRKWRGGEH